MFYDIAGLLNHIDYVNLATFDVQTPERNPKEADYPAPLNEGNERDPWSNVNYQVNYWLQQNTPATKINVGIPTYGRAWKLTSDSGVTGVPPLPVSLLIYIKIKILYLLKIFWISRLTVLLHKDLIQEFPDSYHILKFVPNYLILVIQILKVLMLHFVK